MGPGGGGPAGLIQPAGQWGCEHEGEGDAVKGAIRGQCLRWVNGCAAGATSKGLTDWAESVRRTGILGSCVTSMHMHSFTMVRPVMGGAG
jgi:hypothetical protein